MKAIISGGGGGGSTTAGGGKKRKSSSLVKAGMITRIPRYKTIKLNGEYKMSRVCHIQLGTTLTGITVGGVSRQGIGLIFNPASVTFVGATAGPVQQAIIPSYAEMSALWERVRIDKVVIQISSMRTDPVTNTAGNVSTPVFYMAYDETGVFDNTLAITQQQSQCKTWHGTGNLPDFYFTVYPKYQRIIYYTALLSSYEPARGFVVSDTEIPHYGVRLAIDNNFIGDSVLNMRFTYYYTFADVK